METKNIFDSILDFDFSNIGDLASYSVNLFIIVLFAISFVKIVRDFFRYGITLKIIYRGALFVFLLVLFALKYYII